VGNMMVVDHLRPEAFKAWAKLKPESAAGSESLQLEPSRGQSQGPCQIEPLWTILLACRRFFDSCRSHFLINPVGLFKIGFMPMRQFPSVRLPYPHAGDSHMARLRGLVEFLHCADPIEGRDGGISENANF
jgi:hypothetical protein